VKDTPHQLSLPREQRAGNVRGAFAIDARQARLLQGRRVAVVDDVMTTGTTFAEIARVLQRAGAREVHAWAVARTPRPDEA
jgi:predicted amidophosphoribosyltransferase